MVDYDARCQELGVELFEVPTPMASYAYIVDSGDYVHLAGHGAFQMAEGRQVQRYQGKVGRDLTPDEGREVARYVATGTLSTLKRHLGSLNRIRKIVRVTGYVNADPECHDYYHVTDGASDLLIELFGEAGRHARMSIGCTVLPQQTPFAMDLIAEVDR